ncbi:MAG: hypothetical protein QOD39_2511 [Mycobacterium sp.]|jgi:hypothetical protein|nr:hypothetical protein [Mycobacterium sp.]
MTEAADDRMHRKLREQLGYIQRSADAFDAGHEEEAIRLAGAMRVLFHDKGRNKSLLGQLGMRDATMLSTPRTKFVDWRCFLNVVLDPNAKADRGPVSFTPRLENGFASAAFDDWWENESITNADGTSVTRRRIVLGAADQDGAAHVDPKLERFYEELARGEYGIGLTGDLTFDGPAPYEQGVTHYATNGHLALLRQIAHEVLNTAQQSGWG